MDQLSFVQHAVNKGNDLSSDLFAVYMDIASRFQNYETTYKYFYEKTKEDVNSRNNSKGEHLLIEPIIIPSVSSALFTGMYGDFEYYLNLICNAYKIKHNYKIDLKDISGNGIERAVSYLTKVVQVRDLKNTPEWSKLKHWNRIRNIIVHNNRVIRNQEDKVSIIFLNLNINEKQNRVYLLIDDCKRFLNLILNFFRICI
ncbi:hypothetical protein [Bacillus atrophaeus]|uniref:hypothetical protein n=1 Tax=Bacillus atrophaeus TaxID=1452 RepID=UPI0022822590|nr:hypothetical protein [Bacillus atrophaeus]MCY8842453.1 hypothetical protein [Bacillus atrophaeus]MEC0804663.1 hypothetical protein [Bacillus atrophaeus]MEC0852580.1 hypothetical protein [Bacillus atrophaeus]MEC0859492.1 hypothetical protein [Bacillus atrophaeus]MEC0862299.1 hypothetical protein [Bacillus atrophaeus]